MGKALILIGGGGHAVSCIDVIEKEGVFSIEGIIDQPAMLHQHVLKYPVIGQDSDIAKLAAQGFYFLIAVGQIRSANIRMNIWQQLKAVNARIATVVSPLAYLSRHADVQEGSIIMHGAYVNAGAAIGYNAIINTGAVIEHEAKVGNHCHISTGAILNGRAKTGDAVFIGSRSVINQGVEITGNTVVGSATLIHKDIKVPGTYVGIPYVKID
ncbi:NeuD/PglB/VioB family sugar acetyltransferase [Chitinophaga sp. YIM B06452]|uniref:NeuD/PglB/VioB family sugar acetyltransferase n=1 Tax=Chitinophaga sp. YIM B06452 TaxID=3082158 RepID=UPI0031FF1FC5